MSALLANLLGDSSYTYDYGNAYNTDYNDVLAAINAAEATAGTTESPPDYSFNIDSFYESYDGVSAEDAASADDVAAASADAGRPDGDADTGVKLFENFVDDTASNQFVQALLDDGQTYCWSCHGTGADSAASLADCAANGSSVNCLDQGENDYCMISLRQVNGQITQIESGCAQRDTCDEIHNFYDNNKMDWKKDQCRPNDDNGNAYATNARNRGRESKCSICHYTTKTYGTDTPATVDNNDIVDNISKMRFDNGDVQILGHSDNNEGADTVTLTAGSFGLNWGAQANNVLDMFN